MATYKGMPKSRVVIKDNKEKTRRLEAVLRLAHHSYVTVGILQPDLPHPQRGKGGEQPPTLGQVAAWMEFGTHDRPKRAKLRSKSKPKTIVPARSFLRAPIDNGKAIIDKTRQRVLTALIYERTSIKAALDALGACLQRLSQNAIVRGIAPPLAARTIRDKAARGDPLTPLLTTQKFLYSHIGFQTTLNK